MLSSCAADALYTKAGSILLAVNPYRLVCDRYGDVITPRFLCVRVTTRRLRVSANRSGDCIYDPVYVQRYRERLSLRMLDALPAAQQTTFRLPVRWAPVAAVVLLPCVVPRCVSCVVDTSGCYCCARVFL